MMDFSTLAMVLGVDANTAVLLGIMYLLHGLRSDLRSLERRVDVLEKTNALTLLIEKESLK